jgi:transcriptional regulator with XRE-family HTH domain
VKRHVTIREVAKAAGASVSTISAALNNSDYVSAKMRSRIEEAIKELGYRPNDLARGLRLQKTHTIAIVVPDLSNNFYIEVVRGAKDYSASANYTVLIGDSRESWEEERNYLDSFHRRRVDGVVRVPAIDAPAGKARTVLGSLPGKETHTWGEWESTTGARQTVPRGICSAWATGKLELSPAIPRAERRWSGSKGSCRRYAVRRYARTVR